MRRKIISILLFFILYSLFLIPSPALASSTTLYFGPVERTYDDLGNVTEEKVYYPAGNSTAVKTFNRQHLTYNINYLYSDHLGSTVLVTDENGNKKEDYVYYPYGDVPDGTSFGSKNSETTDKLYTGQRIDSETDLYFYNARYYNPKIGHFLSADKAEGPNRYAYVGNNPVMRNDPSGKQGQTPIIQASGTYNNTINIAPPGQSWCELHPEQCQGDEEGFWSTMGVAGSLAIMPLALAAGPVYEVLDTAICAATSDPGMCMMTAIIPGPAARTTVKDAPEISVGRRLTSKTGLNGSGGAVYRTNIAGKEEIALKILNNPDADGIAYFKHEQKMAQALDDLGVGPKYYGSAAPINDSLAYGMGIVEGDFPDAMRSHVSTKTVQDLRTKMNTIIGAGYDIGDFQYFVRPDGSATIIDPGGMMTIAERNARYGSMDFSLLDPEREIRSLMDLVR